MLEASKTEYFAMQQRVKMQYTLYENTEAWIGAYRKALDTSVYEATNEQLQSKLEALSTAEIEARKARVRIGRWSVCIPGFSCLDEKGALFLKCRELRTKPSWQWFMLSINIVNVLALMTQKPTKDCNGNNVDLDTYQGDVLPAIDVVTNVLFTIDMILGMLVLGLRSYFLDAFNMLDFVVVVTGWIDLFTDFVDFSAFRALRVLRPLRLIRFFKGIHVIRRRHDKLLQLHMGHTRCTIT